MNGTWWKAYSELDPAQKEFVGLPVDGKYLITGPPGCGKTNLLLLRAKHTTNSKLYNVLFITYAKSLADFIRTGVGSYFDSKQVMTYWSWARSHIQTYYPAGLAEYGDLFDLRDDDEKRRRLTALLQLAYEAAPSHTLYDAIFIDEAQDLSEPEIAHISRLSPRITIAGDNRQGLYSQNGLTSGGFTPIAITSHYRIGRRICEVADKLLPPKEGDPFLLDNCRYREDLNKSDAEPNECPDVASQYSAIIERLSSQLRVFPDEMLGVFFPKKEMLLDFRIYVQDTELRDLIAFHDLDDSAHSFGSNKMIHALTIHSSKGAEFRAVHIARGEELKFPLHKREVIFTAVTRAKTSVTLHYTGKINAPIMSAFSRPTISNPEDLFDEL